MLLDVIPKDNYILHLTFENEEQKEFDCKPLLDCKVQAQRGAHWCKPPAKI